MEANIGFITLKLFIMKLFFDLGMIDAAAEGENTKYYAAAAGLLVATPAFALFGDKELAYKRPVM